MLDGPIDRLDRAALDRLIFSQAIEGRTLDFKRDGGWASDAAKREFLCDATSFANSQGGHIIYGMDETGGAASTVAGFPVPDRDAETLRLESILRDGVEPRLPPVLFRWIETEPDKHALVVRIAQSMIGPHRVKYQDHAKFYRRSSAGKYPMDTFELRQAFAATAGLSDQIRAIHDAQVREVLNGLAPVELLSTASHFVLSVIPLSSVIGDLELQIDLSSGFIPAGMPSSIDTFHTIDGFVVAPATPEPHSFGLTARRGLVQYVFRPYLIDRCAIVLQSSEKTIANTVERAIAKLAQFGVAGPFSILLTLTHAAALGATWAEHRPAGRTWSPKRDPLNLPTIVVDDGAGEHLEPLLRSLWFAFGIERTRGNAPGKPD